MDKIFNVALVGCGTISGNHLRALLDVPYVKIVAICDKIRLEAYKRSVRLGAKQNITRDDCNAILSGVRNHISDEEMAKFAAYRSGATVE